MLVDENGEWIRFFLGDGILFNLLKKKVFFKFMEFNQFGIRFIYFMIVKWVFLNFNMFVYFLIRELDNKYCNIDLWKLV